MNKKRILMRILRICSITTILILIGMGSPILMTLVDNSILSFLLSIWIVTALFIIVLNDSTEERSGDDSIE